MGLLPTSWSTGTGLSLLITTSLAFHPPSGHVPYFGSHCIVFFVTSVSLYSSTYSNFSFTAGVRKQVILQHSRDNRAEVHNKVQFTQEEESLQSQQEQKRNKENQTDLDQHKQRSTHRTDDMNKDQGETV